ncbi:C4-dicarboxylate ABC transporter substrate-binding protein [Gallibacterium salpingitidis]|uniref:C4-dicarboxylate ABC transporter substrate-binding protein n=1 Tax=Gallibacterium salpingitidis TaxID=505341 RepID=A0A1A7Q2F1_9PAST|nr:TRAP transporter substrate-binding protein [Gallibacterium salpingitidis]OBW91334.1 C4-dicarboxylate ABC transporter substrate-binding protein [Gallibacterium salpingitidis]OBX09033.1 C4-dicarboxylate ABC transporter substrate-binding protein [Gallibacterium salpingitidis]OBX10153.1 C4-dicarboxylate ABC transporter substrate-binding protein [Gallibacterium salpingitidis]
MKLLKSVLACSLVAFSASVFAADYDWKFQSSDQPGDDAFKYQEQWAKDVEKLSNGRIHISVLGAGSVVEHNQTLDSIGMNIIQGDFTDPSYFSGKDPAFALYGNLIGAWSNPKDLIDFMYNGGGFDVANELLNKYGVQLLAVSTVGGESLVSKKPIHNIKELHGVKVRAPEGLVQALFKGLGAAPVNLPGSEVYTSLEKGVIDASDYSIFARNQANGMNDIAKYPIYPGWHSMPVNQVTLNKKIYDSLPQDLKDVLAKASKQYAEGFLGMHQKLDEEAIKSKKADITIVSWSPEEVAKVREVATKMWPEWAKKSPMSEKYYNVVMKYLKDKGMVK